jgi:hypothetical protein
MAAVAPQKPSRDLYQSLLDRYEFEEEELASLLLALESLDLANGFERGLGRARRVL